MPFPCEGQQPCMHLRSGRTGRYQALQARADPVVSRNRNHLPMNQKLALTTQHTHTHTHTHTQSNLNENKLLRKWILHHHIFLLHCNLRQSKTHLLHTHTLSLPVFCTKYLCISNHLLLRKKDMK